MGYAFVYANISGCGHRSDQVRPEIPQSPVVAEIVVEGNRTFTDEEIIAAIYTETTSKVMFWDRTRLNASEAAGDQQRIDTFYRMQGFFDVVVAPIQILTFRTTRLGTKTIAPPDTVPLGLEQAVPGPGLAHQDGAPIGPDLILRHRDSHIDPTDEVRAAQQVADADILAPGASEESSAKSPHDTLEAPPATKKEEVAPPKHSREAVRVMIRVEEGPRYRVAETRINFQQPVSSSLKAAVQRAITLEEGAFFDLAAQQRDEIAIRKVFEEAAHAWVEVTVRNILIPKANQVRVHYEISPGPECAFDTVVIEGLDNISDEIVRIRAERLIARGAPYSTLTLHRLQKQLYDLQLFQSVLVLPCEHCRGNRDVNIRVVVTEKALEQVKSGAGFTQETDWQELFASVGWSHRFLFERLMRLSLSAKAGWSFNPGLHRPESYAAPTCDETTGVCTSEGRNGPIANLNADLVLPDFKGRQVMVRTGARLLVGQTRSYGYVSPQLYFSANRVLTTNLAVQFGLGVEEYLPTPDSLSQSIFDTTDVEYSDDSDVRFQGLLTYLEQAISYDKRDHILAPQEGLYAAIKFQEAGLIGDFSFVKIVPDFRVYLPVADGKVILSARVSGGAILPFANESAPAVLHFEQGGASNVRGFGWNQITRYVGSGCSAPTPTLVKEAGCTVAAGGTMFNLANLEARFPWKEYGLVAFVDAGSTAYYQQNVLRGFLEAGRNGMQVSAGLGLRYRTPVGPIRLDFGYRLRDPHELSRGLSFLFGNGCPCALHLAIGEAF